MSFRRGRSLPSEPLSITPRTVLSLGRYKIWRIGPRLRRDASVKRADSIRCIERNTVMLKTSQILRISAGSVLGTSDPDPGGVLICRAGGAPGSLDQLGMKER